MNRHIAIIALAAGFLSAPGADAQSHRGFLPSSSGGVAAYLYPHELDRNDRLSDGETEKLFKLEDNTLLLWVDLEPTYRFTHPTAYVLISAAGARIEEGLWWPLLNGRRILSGKQNSVAVISPFQVQSPGGRIDVYFHSEELAPEDRLADGPLGKEIPLRSRSFLMWVDMQPELFFTHRTAYVLIGADKTIRVVDGNWWPELNGRTLLYGTRDKYGVSYPFYLSN